MAKDLMRPEEALASFERGLGKKEIAVIVERTVDTILEEGNVVRAAEALAAMEEFTRRFRRDERYVQFLRDELALHRGKLVTSSGAKIEACEAGVKYDYTSSAEWLAIDREIQQLEQQRKQLEERLRILAPGRMAVDPDTGEVLEGPLKTSTSTYRITLAK
jgi:hypothetical protein